MGIQDIATFIKNEGVAYGSSIVLTKYRHRKVCIDAGTFYSRMMVNNKRILMGKSLESILDPCFELTTDDIIPGLCGLFVPFISAFLSCGVVPVVVFDGSSPEAKSDTRVKRNKKIEEAKDIVNSIRKKYRKSNEIDEEEIHTLRSKLGTIFYIKREHFDILKLLLRESKIPYIQCSEEAERLCVSLVREGVCRSAYSMDSDMIAHLCPNWMQDINTKSYPITANIVKPHRIARKLNLSESQLVDFCIMCGCDYNERVHMMGAVKSFKKIKEHDCIEDVYTKKEMKPLRVAKCREMFKAKDSVDMIVIQDSFMVTIQERKSSIEVHLEASKNDNLCHALSKKIPGINANALEKFDTSRIYCSKYWSKRQQTNKSIVKIANQ